jgi:uncharacterized protein (TIGR01777 family)
MNIGITGGTGFVGRHLSALLVARGHSVTVFSRSRKGKQPNGLATAYWNPDAGEYDAPAFEPLETIVHLAGESVASERWTTKRKKEIVDSRVIGSRTLVDAIRKNAPNCKALISASAVGWYGPDGVQRIPFTEDAPPAKDFLGETCRLWEKEVFNANDFLRVVALRIGIVLGREGGAYPEFTKGLSFGVMPILGSGDQMTSWIHVEDVAAMFAHAIETSTMQGAYNCVAPYPASHRVLMKALAKAKGGLAIPLPVPEFALKIGLGEMSTEVLKSCTVSARKITEAGFRFKFENIETAAQDLAR